MSEGGASSAHGPLEKHLGRLAWYVGRLAAMDAAEVAHRVHEQGRRARERRRRQGWDAFDAGDGPLPGLPIDLDRFRAACTTLLPRLRDHASSIAYGPIRRLDRTWPAVDTPGKWHLDPCSGNSWPSDAYCFDISHRGGRGLGDVKYVWELNRLQHLHPLAALAHVEGHTGLAEVCLAEIESWIDANPPFLGINWASGIELALRAVSILLTTGLVGEGNIKPRSRARIRACLNAHGHWLMRFPSLHSSANNHLIAEAGGLFLIGTLAPDLPAAGAWRQYGRDTLIRESTRQILGDGVGAEQSPTYTSFTLEWYLLCLQVAERAGAPFPPEVRRRLALAAEHLRWMLDDAGNPPRIGDDDEGRVLVTSPEHEPRYVASVLGTLSATLACPDLAPPVESCELRGAILGLPSAPSRPLTGARDFGEGGYLVASCGMNGCRIHLVMDHGPLGHLSIAAHGHADALAVWLGIDGVPVLVDAGTFHYHAGGAWRDHFRSTPAHNTVTIGGASSSQMSGPFNWRRKARTRLTRLDIDTSGVVHAVAETDGFVQATGLTHERSLQISNGAIQITDRILGVAHEPCVAEAGYLINPDLELQASDEGRVLVITRNGRPFASMTSEADQVFAVERGQATPPRGWHSPSFGIREPATRLSIRKRIIPGHASASIATIIRPIERQRS